jgi:hypothetical protein
MLDGDIWVSPAGDFLHRPFDEPQINEFGEGHCFPLGGETVEGITLTAHNQPLQA